ncbi:MAG: hypothetical protein WEB31_01415 [Chthoniobacterales bacterium]
MKYFSLLLGPLALVAVSCERIPPSVSIPDYDQKKAAAEKVEEKPLGAAENPPEFFPSQGAE